jgi:periplasmic protein TonB
MPMEQSLPIEEALPAPDAQQLKRTSYFGLAIAGSLLLHGICSIILIGLPGGPATSPSVTYLDLSMAQPQQAAPTAAPAKPEPQLAPLPEKPAVPEKVETPEPAPQAVQANAVPEQPAAAPPQAKREDEQLPHSMLGLGLTRGFFKSLGEGESLRVGVKEYYLQMLQGINEKWWVNEELQKGKIRPVVLNVVIARSGEIVASNVLMSSGNIRYDNAVLAALKSASPLPPLPQSYQGDFFQAPIRLVPPLNLMSW